ncbi:WD40-repeat-containing domain protein [Mycena floridula]|nr:WD40-repeat-containing domain protein [Mycena floridula]
MSVVWRSSLLGSAVSSAAEPSHRIGVADLSIRNSRIHTVEGDFNSNNTLNSNNTFNDNRTVNITVERDIDEVESIKFKETVDALDKLLEPSLASHARLIRHAQLQVCYPGTREGILRDIMLWIRSESELNILQRCICIVGVPGSGKSTIAATVVESLQELKSSGILSAEFFVRRGITEDSKHVFPTIAQQLARLSRPMANVIHQTVSQRPLLIRQLNNTQIDELFLAPLRTISDIVVVTIDALDELTDPAPFARFLAYIIPNLPSNARLLLTTRHEHDILVHLDSMITKISLELRVNDSVEDVKHYITKKLRDNLRLKFMDDKEWKDWPSPVQIQLLSSHASGLFLWGATAVSHITQFVYKEGLSGRDNALAEVNSIGMDDLDALYGFILQRFLPKSNSAAKLDQICQLIGLLVVSQVPFSLGEICHFLHITPHQFDIKHFMQRARSILVPGLTHIDDDTVPQMHKSFADFITSPRAKEFQIHQPYHHGLALCCTLKSMEGLHFNMCNLQSSYLPNEEVEYLEQRLLQIPFHIRYSCQHWSQHLLLMGKEEFSVLDGFRDFMKHRFLYWLEVLSLSGALAVAVSSMKILAEWLHNQDQPLELFTQDAMRFIASNAQCIAYSAPHIYISALPLSPSSSVVANHYLKQYPRTLSVIQGRKMNWGTALLIINAHNKRIGSVGFSPDGKHVASSSYDCTICIWDAGTGDLLAGPCVGHTGWVNSVAFSPDGKWIVSGCDDKTVRVWDVQTGNLIAGPFQGHTDWVSSAVFSPGNGDRIVSGSADSTAIIWNSLTGKVIAGPLQGHTQVINSVAFSPDGSCVSAVAMDSSIRIWNACTGEIVGGQHSVLGDVLEVTLSCDAKHVAATCDNGVYVWDAEAEAEMHHSIQEFKMKGNWECVMFSPDGNHIVAGAWHHRVVTLDLEHGQVVGGPFDLNGKQVTAIALSHDGQHIVSGSEDGFIFISNAFGATSQAGHNDMVQTVAFSPDGKTIASGSYDDTVRIWDIDTGVLLAGPFEHSSDVRSVAFSPKHRNHLASGDQFTVLIWDVMAGNVVVGPLGYYQNQHHSIAFSPDGLQIASCSEAAIQIWNAETGENMFFLLQDTEYCIYHSVAFSLNGQYITSGFEDGTACVWDATTGHVASHPMQESQHEETVSSIAFSPDGTCIVSGSQDATIHIWNATTGRLVQYLTGHKDGVRSVAFSPDGDWIVSGSDDMTIRIWNATTRTLGAVLRGHTLEVTSVQISPDGKHLVSGSEDHTLRIWDFSQILQNIKFIAAHSHVEIPIMYEDSSEMVNGWIMGQQHQLLFWVPPDYQTSLWRPSNTGVIGDDVLRLDFSNFVHGTNWTAVTDCAESTKQRPSPGSESLRPVKRVRLQ